MDTSTSTPVAITIKRLGKLYYLGTSLGSYPTLRDTLMDGLLAPLKFFRRPAGNPKASSSKNPESIWALKDVSLTIAQGDIVGIVGKNGAGKTTLLKVLSRITEPTEGRATLRGRVGSLLEVGSGFHPELTGRENIFLNGAILGMSRQEISRKFSEIVDFAEIEPFLDTPLKRYSTGMGTRLAFAIAAHLDTDILLLDEILAVGDMGFRKKCLGKMQDVTHAGRTVLFVSHDLNSIRRFCRKAVWLDQGRIMAEGEVQEVMSQYEASFREVNGQQLARVERRDPPKSQKWFSWVALATAEGRPSTVFRNGDTLCLSVGFAGRTPHHTTFFEWYVNEVSKGVRVAWGGAKATSGGDIPGNCQELNLVIGPLPLTIGSYTISLNIGVSGVALFDFWHDAISFEIIDCKAIDSNYRFSNEYAPVYIPYKINIIQ